VLEDGLALGERINWAAVGKGEISNKDVVDFGFSLLIRLEILECGAFLFWAKEMRKLH